MRPKHLLALTSTTEAVNDHRLYNFLRKSPPERVTEYSAKDMNIDARKSGAPLLDVLDRWCAQHQDEQYDVVWTNIWHLEIAAVLRWAAETLQAKIVVDQDDLLTNLGDDHPSKGFEYHMKEEARAALIGEADVVVNSTPALQEENGGIVCPNFADPENWVTHGQFMPLGRWRHRILCPISASRVLEWEDMVGDAFLALLKDFPDVQWVFFGGWPLQADDAPSGQVIRANWAPNWLYKRLVQWLQPTVILSPLRDNPFNRAKSNLKYLEAGLTGSAFIGSPVGELKRTVEHGVTGLLSDDLDAALRQVLSDDALHQKLATEAKHDVLTNWTWPAVEDQWEEVWSWPSRSLRVS